MKTLGIIDEISIYSGPADFGSLGLLSWRRVVCVCACVPVCHSKYTWSSFMSVSTVALKIELTKPKLEWFDRISCLYRK